MKNTALLILDMINDVIHPDSPVAQGAQTAMDKGIIQKANTLSRGIRAQGGQVIFFKVGFSHHYQECPTQPWSLFKQAPENRAYELGQWGTELHKDLQHSEEDLVLVKHRVSPFYATPLEAILKPS